MPVSLLPSNAAVTSFVTAETFSNDNGNADNIKAKQIIKYRDLHKGFKSKEEFFEQMKIKKHFRKQQYEYIVLSEYKIKEECVEERILDF